jgi:polysaccharide pyruvyl transferase WcaK-like protein
MPNFGDELILNSVLNWWKENFDCNFSVFTGSTQASSDIAIPGTQITWLDEPMTTAWNFAGESDSKVKSLLELLEKHPEKYTFPSSAELMRHQLMEADVFHVAGGGWFREGLPHAVSALGFCLDFLSKYNPDCRILLTGQGIGLFQDHSNTRDLAVRILRTANLVDLREDRGLEFSTSCGINSFVTCDDAFLSSVTTSDLLQTHSKPYALIQLTEKDRFKPESPGYRKFREICLWLLDEGIELQPVKLANSSSDVDCMFSELKCLPVLDLIDASAMPLDSFASIIKNSKIAVGSRFHMTISSNALGVPCLALPTSIDSGFRHESYFSQLGIGEYGRVWTADSKVVEIGQFLHGFLLPPARETDQIKKRIKTKTELMRSQL